MGVYKVKCTCSGNVIIPTAFGDKSLAPGQEFDLAADSQSCWMAYNETLQGLITAGMIAVTEDTYTAEPRVGAFAYVPDAPTVTTTLADTWYPVPGPFVNVLMESFSVPAPYTYIVYTGAPTVFEVQTNGTWSTDTNQTTIQTAIRINDIVDAGSLHIAKIAQATQYRHISSTITRSLSTNDTVQLVIKSDQAGAALTVQSFSTSAQKFY